MEIWFPLYNMPYNGPLWPPVQVDLPLMSGMTNVAMIFPQSLRAALVLVRFTLFVLLLHRLRRRRLLRMHLGRPLPYNNLAEHLRLHRSLR